MIFLLRSVLFIKGVEIFSENMVGLIVVFCATNIHLKINYSDAVTLPMLSSIKIRNKSLMITTILHPSKFLQHLFSNSNVIN